MQTQDNQYQYKELAKVLEIAFVIISIATGEEYTISAFIPDEQRLYTEDSDGEPITFDLEDFDATAWKYLQLTPIVTNFEIQKA